MFYYSQIIIVFSQLLLFNKVEPNFTCDDLIVINEEQFIENKLKGEEILKSSNLKKIDNAIAINYLNLNLEDNLTDEDFFEYTILGSYKKWEVILGQDYNQNYYFLIDNFKMDTLIGLPVFFDNIVLAIEEPHTDFQEIIEIWNITSKSELQLYKRFSLKKCYDFRILESYLKDGFFFFKTGNDFNHFSYYKIQYN